MEHGGTRLLGYNQNAGALIAMRLRTMDLAAFMPYDRLVDTLLHELCHNEVGPHNEHFWHLFCQLKASAAPIPRCRCDAQPRRVSSSRDRPPTGGLPSRARRPRVSRHSQCRPHRRGRRKRGRPAARRARVGRRGARARPSAPRDGRSDRAPRWIPRRERDRSSGWSHRGWAVRRGGRHRGFARCAASIRRCLVLF